MMTELQASGAGARVSHPADERQARYGVHPAQAHRFIEAPEYLHRSAPQSRLLHSQKVSRGPHAPIATHSTTPFCKYAAHDV